MNFIDQSEKSNAKRHDKELSWILYLVTALKEETILPVQFSQLNEILSANPKAGECYIEIIQLYVDLEFLYKQCSVAIPASISMDVIGKLNEDVIRTVTNRLILKNIL